MARLRRTVFNARIIACWEDHLFGATDLLRLTRTAIVMLTGLGTSYISKLTSFPVPVVTSEVRLQATE